MPDPAIAKVEDALGAVLTGYAPLAAYTVVTGRDSSEAFDSSELPLINIYTESQQFGPGEEQGQTIHDCRTNFEILENDLTPGVMSRTLQTAAAHIVAALAADRTLGNRLQDLQERDLAPPADTGRDVAGASLQYDVQFYTPRDDHFTIVGLGGAIF